MTDLKCYLCPLFGNQTLPLVSRLVLVLEIDLKYSNIIFRSFGACLHFPFHFLSFQLKKVTTLVKLHPHTLTLTCKHFAS